MSAATHRPNNAKIGALPARSRSAPRLGLRHALVAALTAGFVAALLSSVGCSNLIVHSFSGQHYDATNDCLDPKGVLDVVEGEAHGTCTGVRCYVVQTDGGDGDAFVSTSCEGAPNFRDGTEDKDGSVCALALAAYAKGADGACKTNA